MPTVSKNRRIWLYCGWLLVSVIALALAVVEVLEHQPIRLNQLDLGFVAEVLLLGLVFPLVGGVTLGWLNRTHTSRAFPAQAHTVPRVLVIKNELLGLGIKHLLSQEPGLHVISILPENHIALLDAIKRLQPVVVVMDRDTNLAKAIELSTFPRDLPPVRFIMVNAENERVQIHDLRQVLITQTDELTTLIRGS